MDALSRFFISERPSRVEEILRRDRFEGIRTLRLQLRSDSRYRQDFQTGPSGVGKYQLGLDTKHRPHPVRMLGRQTEMLVSLATAVAVGDAEFAFHDVDRRQLVR